MTATPEAVQQIYLIPLSLIDPDPDQPRLDADDELKESIRANGIEQPIIVRSHPDKRGRYMIIDGERRWRGSAGVLTKIRARIEEDPLAPADRLVQQLVTNTGKPLTPIEEAFAFRRIMEEKHWSQVQLAKQLGIARSTVGDRVRLASLDDAWLALYRQNRLQASYAPIIYRYRAVPSKYQAEAVQRLLDREARMEEDDEGQWSVSEFEWRCEAAFSEFLEPLGNEGFLEQGAYEGPVVVEVEDGEKIRYAADPDIWRPLIEEAEAKRRAERKEAREAPSRRAKPPELPKMPEGVKQTVVQGYLGVYLMDQKKDGVAVWFRYSGGDGNWRFGEADESDLLPGFDVDEFLRVADPTKLELRASRDGTAILLCRDESAVSQAAGVWREAVANQYRELVGKLASKIRKHAAGDAEGLESLLRALIKRSAGGEFRYLSEHEYQLPSELLMLELADVARAIGALDFALDAAEQLSMLDTRAAADVLAAYAVAKNAGAKFPYLRLGEWEHEQLVEMSKRPLVFPNGEVVEADKPAPKKPGARGRRRAKRQAAEREAENASELLTDEAGARGK